MRSLLLSLCCALALAAPACAGGSQAGKELPPGAYPPVAAQPAETSSASAPAFRATTLGRVQGIPTGIIGTADKRHLLVAQVTGEVRIFKITTTTDGVRVPRLLPEPVLDVSSLTRFDGQNRGLLGIALVDGGQRIALSFTDRVGTLRVVTYPWNGGKKIQISDGREAAAIPHPFAGLTGGGIATLKDGSLALAVGDMSQRFTNPPAAQDAASPLGSVLRIQQEALAASPSNTSANSASISWLAKGLRNPWGVSTDTQTGDVWLGDVGDHQEEEIDRIPFATMTSEVPNFGWPFKEGNAAGTETPPVDAELVAPVHARKHRFEVCSIVGGVMYRGRALPSLRGSYLFGDLCSDRIQASVSSGKARRKSAPIGKISEKIIGFGTDANDEVYVLGLDGLVVRLDPADWNVRNVPTSPTTTTSVVSAKPGESAPAKCAVIDVFGALDGVNKLDPTEAQKRFTRARKLLELGVTTPVGPVNDDIEQFRTVIEQLATTAIENDWDFSRPALANLYGEISSSQGRFGFVAALIDRLIEAVADCPGESVDVETPAASPSPGG